MAVRFDPTKEVPSLELCERLKELGYSQDGGGWYWIKYKKLDREAVKLTFSDKLSLIPNDYGANVYHPEGKGKGGLAIVEYYKAPTTQELKKWLPNVLPSETGSVTYGSYNLRIWFDLDVCKIEYFAPFCQPISDIQELGHLASEGWELYKTEVKVRVGDKTEANARAKMIIWLVENGYIKFKGEKQVGVA